MHESHFKFLLVFNIRFVVFCSSMKPNLLFHPSWSSRATGRGFALVITLMLMVLLAVLSIGLLTLSSTSLRTGSAGNAQQVARDNARFALCLAISEIQKCAGPDQRTTASADIATGIIDTPGTAGSRLATGAAKNHFSEATPSGRPAIANGITGIAPGTRHWTGVWGNYGGYTGASLNDIYRQAPAPVLLSWLVSGNQAEIVGKTDPTTGFITTSPAAPSFLPSHESGGISETSNGTASLTINGKPAILLAGAKSFGGDTEPDRFVAAPLVEIAANGSGFASRYAYWVGDEGVKAKINISDTLADRVDTKTDLDARARLMTPPRSGLEVLSDFSSSHYQALSQTAGNSSSLLRVISHAQSHLMDSSLSQLDSGKQFHSITTFSSGLATNNYRGGMKRDLSLDFAQSSLPSWTNAHGQTGGAGSSIIPAEFSPQSVATNFTAAVPAGTAAMTHFGPATASSPGQSSYGNAPIGTPAPVWDILYDHLNYYSRKNAGGAIPTQAALSGSSTTQMGVAPVVVHVRVLLGAQTTLADKTLRALFTPLIVLGNPYTVPLSLDGLTAKFVMPAPQSNIAPDERAIAFSYGLTDVSGEGDRFMRLLPYEHDSIKPSKDQLHRNMQFSLPNVTIPPGETVILSLKSDHISLPNTAVTVPLEAGEAEDFAAAYHFAGRIANTNHSSATATQGFYKFNESEIFSPMAILIQNAAGEMVQRVGGLNLDSQTNSYGIYHEKNRGTTEHARIISAFNFQLGDPGSLNKTIRPYMDFNLRAANNHFLRHPPITVSANPANTALEVPGYWRSASYSNAINTANGGGSSMAPTVPPVDFTKDLSPPQWGYKNADTKPLLYDIPQEPVLSLGALQHANVTADDVALNVAHQPGHAIGNSYAPIFMDRSKTKETLADRYSGNRPYNYTNNYYDISYLLNAALWDDYFFSSILSTSTDPKLRNPRYSILDPTATDPLADAEKIASQLMIDGAFNINSTSVEAWAVFLAGMRGLPSLPENNSSNANESIFPRSLRQKANGQSSASGNTNDSYSGFRKLSDAQILELSAAIVKQVRLRGPFVSLAQFVNRELVSTNDDPTGIGYAGALQHAIDQTSINDFSGINALNDTVDTSHYYYAANYAKNAPRTPRISAGIPAWLTQADVLQATGPLLTTRSDTFIVRAYGETLDKDGKTVLARAWCEAVVQRSPQYLDPSDSAWEHPSKVSASNQIYGRRFNLVSFRWLSPDEI